MAVGVPETAVFQAADAVLARGERPRSSACGSNLGAAVRRASASCWSNGGEPWRSD